jgi:SAM-dependent methyltransferase
VDGTANSHLKAQIANCPTCGCGSVFPFETRTDQYGRVYDLRICADCSSVLNWSDLTNSLSDRERLESQGEAVHAIDVLSDDHVAELPAQIEQHEDAFIKFLLQTWPEVKRGSYLDFGAGKGLLAVGAAKHFESVYALEIDLSVIRRVMTYSERPERIHPVSRLEDINSRLDVVSFIHVLEHLTDINGTISTVSDMLSPGGVILYQVPMLRNDYLMPVHYTFMNDRSARIVASKAEMELIGPFFDCTNNFMTCVMVK